MNETPGRLETPPSAPVNPVEEKVQQLSADAAYLAGLDRAQLSPEDQIAYDELVALRQADYRTNAEAIREHTRKIVRAGNTDMKYRVDSGDHNAR